MPSIDYKKEADDYRDALSWIAEYTHMVYPGMVEERALRALAKYDNAIVIEEPPVPRKYDNPEAANVALAERCEALEHVLKEIRALAWRLERNPTTHVLDVHNTALGILEVIDQVCQPRTEGVE